jgi:hypothetical protein
MQGSNKMLEMQKINRTLLCLLQSSINSRGDKDNHGIGSLA